MKLVFEFDPVKCSACAACAVACMDQNDIDVSAGQQPYRRIFSYEKDGEYLCLSIACLHCTDAPCIAACPFGCLYKDPDSGLTRYDNTKCVGCRACFRACPYDAPTFRPTGNGKRVKMEKCHGCLERVEAGMQPACVHTCPTKALTFRLAEDSSPDDSLAELYQRWNSPQSDRKLCKKL